MSTQYLVLTLISFLISFSITSFSIANFPLNNFILFVFLLCWQLQCKHSYQYFVYFHSIFNLISSFSIYIFLFNNFISCSFCVVSTTSMWTLMPIFCLNFNFIFNSILRYFIFHVYFSIEKVYLILLFDNCNVDTHANILFEL